MVDDIFAEENEIFDFESEPDTKESIVEPTDNVVTKTENTNVLDNIVEQSVSVDKEVNIYADLDAEDAKLRDVVFDHNKLMDPKYTEVVKRIMSLNRRRRNRMFESEFEQFIPLFKQDNDGLSTKEIDSLYERWQKRVSQYDPVEVFDSDGKLVRVIPATFARAALISEMDPELAGNVINGMQFASQLDNDFNGKQTYWGNRLIQTFRMSQNNEDKAKQVAIAEEQAMHLLHPEMIKQTNQKENNSTPPSDTSNMEISSDEPEEEYL